MKLLTRISQIVLVGILLCGNAYAQSNIPIDEINVTVDNPQITTTHFTFDGVDFAKSYLIEVTEPGQAPQIFTRTPGRLKVGGVCCQFPLQAPGSTYRAQAILRRVQHATQWSDAVVDNNGGGGTGGNGDLAALFPNLDTNGDLDTRPGVFAFPGATGYGRFAAGGRGAPIYCVNTLDNVVAANDGLIGYREAIEGIGDVTNGPRNITFCVSGEINSIDDGNTPTVLRNSFVSVACQTAPSPGVVITGYRPQDIQGVSTDIVFRHCDLKPRDTLNLGLNQTQTIFYVDGNLDAGGSRRIICDHCSLMWGTDGTFVLRDGGHETTLSHSIIGEGDTTCRRSQADCGETFQNHEDGDTNRYLIGDSSHGPQIGAQNSVSIEGVSMIANLVINTDHRTPVARWMDPGEIANNLVVNWRERGTNVRERNDVYIENNIYKSGLDTSDDADDEAIVIPASPGNYAINNNTRILRDGTIISNFQGSLDASLTLVQDIPGVERGYTTGNSDLNLDCIGASRPFRDSADQRLVNEANGSGAAPVLASAEIGIGPRIPPIVQPEGPCIEGERCYFEGDPNTPISTWTTSQGQRDYTDYAGSNAHPATYDTDGDGIEDAYEQRIIDGDLTDNITSLADVDHTTDSDNDGYYDAEEWMSELARCA